MSNGDDLCALDPVLEFPGQPDMTDPVRVSDLDEVKAGTKFMVNDVSVEEPLYVYVIVLPADVEASVAVLYHPTAQLDPGSAVRIPAGDYLTSPIDGELRVMGSARVIDDAEWSELIEGRNPPIKTGTTKEGVV